MRKRGAALLLAAALAVTGLAGCGASSGETASGGEKVRLMVWSPQNDQSKDNGEWLQTMCEAFAEEHPEWDILYLCQPMTDLDLFGTVDTTICALDSINHLTDPVQVRQAFQKVSLFTAPGGLFLFDVNTPYKHREILGNSCYVYEFDDLFCAWQNFFEEETCSVTVQLDFFSEENGHYVREQEYITERAYTRGELSQWLKQAGFDLLAVYGEDSMKPPAPDCQRWIFAARKK